MRIIGIDPGLKTGMILLEVPTGNSPVPLAYATHDPHDVINALEHFATEADGSIASDTRVVVEKFVAREGVHGKDDTAQTLNGMITHWAIGHQMLDRVSFQLPGERAMVTTAVLKNLGLWLSGHKNRHVMDAARHVVAFLVKMRHPMTMAKGWKR